MQVCVVALGKIGLPLAVQFARKGHRVIGCDVDARTVESVNAGVAPFPNEAGLEEALAEVVAAGLLSATVDTTTAVASSQAVVVVVPLFVDADAVPDFGWMDAATKAIGAGLTPGTLVSYETTLPVGTTRTRWAPMLEEASGLTAGTDFHLAFSPERVLTGRVFADLRKYPKLVGGIDETSGAHAEEFYRAVLDFDDRDDLPQPNGVWNLGSAEAAEMAKLAETTYRDVNIGLANQFARFADTIGVDVLKVIEACNSQPYSHIHRPGIAVGGHCIPIYPRLYLWNDPDGDRGARGTEANAGDARLRSGPAGRRARRPVGGAGAGAGRRLPRRGEGDGVLRRLPDRGGAPGAAAPTWPSRTRSTAPQSWRLSAFPRWDGEPVEAAVIQSDHAEYRTLTPADLPGVRTLVDGRRVTDPAAWTGVRRVVIGG